MLRIIGVIVLLLATSFSGQAQVPQYGPSINLEQAKEALAPLRPKRSRTT